MARRWMLSPPTAQQQVAAAILEAGGLEDAQPLDPAPSRNRLVVTVAAPFPVVERAEPLVGGGEALEEGTADQEPASFAGGQPGKRLSESRQGFGVGAGARRGQGSGEEEDRMPRAGCHGRRPGPEAGHDPEPPVPPASESIARARTIAASTPRARTV